MIPTRTGSKLIVLIAATLALGACGKAPPPPPAPAPAPPAAPAAPAAQATPAPAAVPAGTTFQSVALGKAVDGSGKLTGEPTSEFGPKDTVYAVVSTNNAGSSPATITAHWEFQGGVTVNEGSQTVSASGPSVTTFHIEKASGWPVGHYRVVISIDGKQAAIKEFEVK